MDNNMVLYDLEHFSIYHKNENIQTLKDIENVLNETYNKAIKFYEINIENTDVYIYNNQLEFQKQKNPDITIENVINWWVRETMYNKILAISPKLETNSGHNYQSILNVIAHEFIHTVNNKINNNCNIWIDEGIALYLSNGDKSKDILKKYNIPNIEIFNVNNVSTFNEENGYIFADKIIEYVYNKYGKNKVIELIKNNNYENVLGKNIKEIYKEWVNYLNENYI